MACYLKSLKTPFDWPPTPENQLAVKKVSGEIPGNFPGFRVENRLGVGSRGQNGAFGGSHRDAGFCGRGEGAARTWRSETTPAKQLKKVSGEFPGNSAGFRVENRLGEGHRGHNGALGRSHRGAGFCGRANAGVSL